MKQTFLLICLIAFGFTPDITAQQTVASEGAWCWFADPRAMHYANDAGTINMSWLGYIDVHGNIKATQMDWLTGQKTDVLVRSYFQPDDHNNPTFLVLPDERVLIIYSRHTDEAAFYYRVSQTPGDITTLGDEKKIVTANNTTYPSPFILSDDPEHFYLCWRGISWHPTIARITLPDDNDDVSVDWGPYQIVQSTGARPYAKYYSNGKDKIYVTYTTGHPDNEQPNWVYFNVVNINATTSADGTVSVSPTLNDITGTELSTIQDGAFNVNKTDSYKSSYPNTVVDSPSSLRDWVWQVALDSMDRPRIAMVKINSGKTQHEYYYARWTGSAWALTDLGDGGYKFHSSSTEYCYSGGMSLDPQNPGDIYVSRPTEGANGTVFELWKLTVDDEGVLQSETQITSDSEKNNVRPFILPDSEGTPLRLGWMHGDYAYWMVNKNYPTGYPTSIQWDYTYSRPGNQETTDGTSPNAFGVQATIELDADDYQGTLIETPYYTYALDGETQTPYIEINGVKTYSTNCLLSSDDWSLYSSGTNSDYWPTKLASVNIAISCQGKSLKVYRNGFLDQNIELEEAFEGSSSDIWAKCGGTNPGEITPTGVLYPEDVWQNLEDETLLSLYVPATPHTDIVMPTSLNGTQIEWASSNEDIIAADGTFTAPDETTTVTLTATTVNSSRTFTVEAQPRDIETAIRAHFTFETEDVQTIDGQKYVIGKDSRQTKMAVMGSATIDSTLNLTANTAAGFTSNGYGIVDANVMDSLRSYTFLLEATPNSLTSAPRFYDFGLDSGNSLFFRANALSAGIKYASGTTTMTSSSNQLSTGTTYKLAVTYDARTGQTSIYVNGELWANGTENTREPYELALLGECSRNYVGRTQWWEGSYASSNVDFQGTMDDFIVMDICLTQSEIQEFQTGEASTDSEELVEMENVILNPGFELSYTAMSPSTVASDRAIMVPENWTVSHSNQNEYDMSIIGDNDVQASLFSDVPVEEGTQAYRIRQNWGTSTISLTQELDTLPMGIYQLQTMTWQSGLGGQAGITTSTPDGQTETKNPTANATVWQLVRNQFMSDGTQAPTITLNAVHTSDGSTKFIGFDNLKLYDATEAANASELYDLITYVLPRAQALSEKLPSNEDLSQAIAKAQSASADDQQGSLLSDYQALRDAMLTAQDLLTSIQTPNADLQETNKYDLAGRPASKTSQGILIERGNKTLVR